MKKCTLFILFIATILCTSCNNNSQPTDEQRQTVGTSTSIEGDSTLYGLACHGCTDSVLVFLPGKGGDPVTYDILQANTQGRVFGRPQVGDWVAVIVNGEDTLKADMVIDLDQLKGSWVQLVRPTLRERLVQEGENVPYEPNDSTLIQKLMRPVEIGFSLKRHYSAQAIGRRYGLSSTENSPVIYPVPRNYTKWHVINGQLVLTVEEQLADSTAVPKAENDTASFVMMLKDSLVLKFGDEVRHYYRRNEQASADTSNRN